MNTCKRCEQASPCSDHALWWACKSLKQPCLQALLAQEAAPPAGRAAAAAALKALVAASPAARDEIGANQVQNERLNYNIGGRLSRLLTLRWRCWPAAASTHVSSASQAHSTQHWSSLCCQAQPWADTGSAPTPSSAGPRTENDEQQAYTNMLAMPPSSSWLLVMCRLLRGPWLRGCAAGPPPTTPRACCSSCWSWRAPRPGRRSSRLVSFLRGKRCRTPAAQDACSE